jgi:hypothetical protein
MNTKSKTQLNHVELEEIEPQHTNPMIPSNFSFFPSIVPIDFLQTSIMLLNSSATKIMEITNRTLDINLKHSSQNTLHKDLITNPIQKRGKK